MTKPIEYELTTNHELDLFEALREETKLVELHTFTLNVAKAMLKKIAGDADYITIDGRRVLQIIRTRPARFDSRAFKAYDHRLYESFMRPADAEVVTLRWVDKP